MAPLSILVCICALSFGQAIVSADNEQICSTGPSANAVIRFLVEEAGANLTARDGDFRTVLHVVAQNGTLQDLQYLVEAGVDQSATDKDSMTPLHLAAAYNTLPVVKYLVEQAGANVSVQDKESKTPLHLAAIHNTFGVVRYLVEEAGASVTAEDHNQRTPASYAGRNTNNPGVPEYLRCIEELSLAVCHLQNCQFSPAGVLMIKSPDCTLRGAVWGSPLITITKLVEEDGANLTTEHQARSLLHIAAGHNTLPVVRYLVKKAETSVDPKKLLLRGSGPDDFTPLHAAATYNNVPVIKFLVEEVGGEWWYLPGSSTLLHLAAMHNTLPVVKYLVEQAGTRVSIKDIESKTPLHLAAMHNTFSVVRYLVEEAGARVTARDLDQRTPASYAGRNRNNPGVPEYLRCIEELSLAATKETHFSPDNSGDLILIIKSPDCALRGAVWGSPLPTIKKLIEEDGANLTTDHHERSLLHNAARHNTLPVIKYLVKKLAANVDPKKLLQRGSGPDSNTVLHVAAGYNTVPIVKFLVEEVGGEVNVKSRSSATPLHYAVLLNTLPVVKYLVEEAGASLTDQDIASMTPLQFAENRGETKIIQYLKCIQSLSPDKFSPSGVLKKTTTSAC